MPYEGTKNHNEPDDLETAYFFPSWHDKGVFMQSVSMAPLDERELSFVAAKSHSDHGTNFVRLVFTEEEVDLLIKGLTEAKKRWAEGKVLK